MTGPRVARRLPAFLFAAGLIFVAAATGADAATPSSGSVSWSHPTQDWGNAGMTGSAEVLPAQSCSTVPTECDDFPMTVDTKRNGAVDANARLEIKLTGASSGASFSLFVYPPGCTTPNSSCEARIGTDGAFDDPANGDWKVRALCIVCPPGSSYTAEAGLKDAPPPNIPGAGSQAFKWSVTQLGPKDAQGATVSYGEPGISFNSKGEGIVNTFGPTVWVTGNSGRTWSLPYNLAPQDTLCAVGSSGDADAQAAEDGTLYVDNLCLPGVGGTSNDIFVNQAGGNPSKWTGPTLAGVDVDRQWLAVDPAHPGTVYMEFHDLEGPDINVLKSTDYGQTWLCPITGLPEHQCTVTLTTNSNTGFVDTGVGNTTARMLIDPTDTDRLYVAYADNCALNSLLTPPNATDFDLTRIHVAVSTDGGHSWSANTAPDQSPAFDANAVFGGTPCSTLPPSGPTCDNTISHTFPTDAIDSKGNLYLVFSMRRCNDTQTHLYLIASQDHGQHWTPPRQVDQGGLGANLMEWVAAGDPGRLAISWYGSPAKDFNSPAAQWSEVYAVSTNALSGSPSFTQSRVSGPKSIHNADICEAGTFCLFTGGNRDLADFQGVAIDPCGWAHPVWTDDSTGQGFTMTARQTAGPNLFATNHCPTTTPFTAGAGYLAPGAWLGEALAGIGFLALVAAAALGLRPGRRAA